MADHIEALAEYGGDDSLRAASVIAYFSVTWAMSFEQSLSLNQKRFDQILRLRYSQHACRWLQTCHGSKRQIPKRLCLDKLSWVEHGTTTDWPSVGFESCKMSALDGLEVGRNDSLRRKLMGTAARIS